MNFKTIAGLVGLLALVGFLLPAIFKLKSVALSLVVLAGIAMAAYEYYENLRHKDD
jgi:ABC-type iron transport system FetAB permease component